MLKLIVSLMSLFVAGNALAHVGSHSPIQHFGEHLLLSLVFAPLVWLLVPRISRVLSRIRRK